MLGYFLLHDVACSFSSNLRASLRHATLQNRETVERKEEREPRGKQRSFSKVSRAGRLFRKSDEITFSLALSQPTYNALFIERSGADSLELGEQRNFPELNFQDISDELGVET